MNRFIRLLFVFTLIGWNSFQNNDFIFLRENQKVVLKMEDGMKFLKWNEKTKLILSTENIDTKSLSLSAPGLRFIKGTTDNDNESIWEITPHKKLIKNDTLKLFIRCQDLKGSFWSHKFKILVRH